MKLGLRALCVFLAALPVAASAADRPPLELKPASDWVLDYAEERCSFYRAFGEGDDALVLRMDSFGSPVSFRILVSGPAVPNFNRATDDLVFRFTPDKEDRETIAINGKVGDQPGVSFSAAPLPYESPDAQEGRSDGESAAAAARPRPPQPEFEALIRTVEMRFTNGRAIRLSLGNMAKPFAAMRDCVDNLQRSWGLDPAVQKGLSRLAVPKPSTVRRVQARYPLGMLNTGTNAYVPVRVMVAAEGKATACVVQAEQIPTDFKKAVCSGLMHNYEPARDAGGGPVASVYQTSVFYLIQ